MIITPFPTHYYQSKHPQTLHYSLDQFRKSDEVIFLQLHSDLMISLRGTQFQFRLTIFFCLSTIQIHQVTIGVVNIYS